jgi:glycosyltransferase involved in cell wall biosynthesis
LAVLHSADVHALARLPGRGRLAGEITRGASALLFTSAELRQRFFECLSPLTRTEAQTRSHVCPMGIDPPRPHEESRQAVRRRLGLHRFTALALGRLVPIKGLDDAIRAVAGRQDMELVLAGEGPDRARLQALARELEAPVRFEGLVHGRHKHDLLAAADVFVAPSRQTRTGRTEGTPTAVLEAMAAGVPVVCTPAGGLAAIAEDGRNARIVPAQQPDRLRDVLCELARDPRARRRLARAARTTGRLYTWPEIAPHLEALLEPPRQ